ncbi:SMC-Scp complex subunit ScpB [Candidatus Nitrosocosmicus arcticus]|uniref:Chromosome segregation and condensation protein ScpB n=1 Tax=Candidatus Nitrosocosmicus arcticus TaxID=2035267 RepID=A0A557SYD7_9ARCH|nr:SMC-Scp complex subunit ScpB [Candidatus Nitrosocosmicus arcticus]TVP41611.1 Chromosome segregation and condensation protein ScpB [Candidatus Nitrosocosmicus arcticus]
MTKLPADEIIARIEAALYSAGRPLTIDEIAKASGIDSRERIKRLLSELINKTKIAFKALEIAKLEDGTYVFQLKPSYAPIIKKFSNKPQFSNSVMKTLSYVAYEQPVTSKRLVEIRGSKVYMHLKELQDLEFISHKSSGRVKIYNTTPKFKNYFGIGDIATLKKSLLLNPKEFVKKNT